ncbi:SDR family NAD(P)-dependent oxidoreductase [Candidatus Mycobacterium wuenschmannii]|uniref:SDR family NAD(P)-dependent oxidoreductase n=1 Tax=Candidatus Mycobacterium wuenschmannii TaxID=3027808 RepID=A0ABY8W326_9MYCO|nr:SDR family NAD(P)-dependent oxidoreductase [Candidatus Mycobacterium wuenschmannii]WIM88823.1 SDR family NAD(P)-dependent oxidoreductase [Candidatus Mycobacterium wuenschmannii]
MIDTAKYGPWALIAGGSEGVGAEFAMLLAGAGLNLVLVARSATGLDETATRCRRHGGEIRTLQADLSDPAVCDQIAAATSGLEVGLLILVAGANTHSHEFLDGDLAEFHRVIDLNVSTPLALTQHYGRAMRQRGRGGIVVLGSLSGYLGSARHTVYGGVKAFSRIFAEGLWLELREHGVDVLELVLGVTRTPAMERIGLNFDAPGVIVTDPADVAREGLEWLGRGPVHIVSGNERIVSARSDPDRATAVLAAHRTMQRLLHAERNPDGGGGSARGAGTTPAQR